jgi:CheY-like chemotaxis protein
MCQHMQNVPNINRHANVEPTISLSGMQLEPDTLREQHRIRVPEWDGVPQKRILLVDDYPDALEIWGLYLRSIGYDVIEADDGLEAVAQAQLCNPDVIVLDLELPGITGFEAAVRLRASAATRDIPLIAATGYSHVKQLDQARASGFDAIVVKPCEPAALVGEIERLLHTPRRTPGSSAGKRFSQNR